MHMYMDLPQNGSVGSKAVAEVSVSMAHETILHKHILATSFHAITASSS